MRTAIAIGLFIGMIGCGDTPGGSCAVAPTDVVGYQDCGVTLADGTSCVAMCGRLPADGSPGTSLSPGCQIQIGTSAPRVGSCVADCSECK